MQANHSLCGEKKGGYIKTTQEDGSNGIVDTTQADESRVKINDKLHDGQL